MPYNTRTPFSTPRRRSLPLWPLATVVGIMYFLGQSLATRALASTETVK